MKTLITIITILIFPLSFNAQTKEDTTKIALVCDSIILSSGETMTCLIQEMNKKKIIYFFCCDVCAVPREIKTSLIDTIIYSDATKNRLFGQPILATETNPIEFADVSQEYSDSIRNLQVGAVLMLKKKYGNQKEFIIREGIKLTVINTKGIKFKGKFEVSEQNEVKIGGQTLAIQNISSISMHYKGSKIIGGILGGTATLVTFYLSWLSGFDEPVTAFIPASASLFSIMAIKRKFDLVKKFDLYLLH
jgi:hypothetical protein